MPKIRQEQIDFTGLSFSDYATKSDLSNASGTLDTKINTLSGNFNNYATTTVLGSASGTLNSKIDSISGVLNSKISSIPTIPSGINDLNDVTTTGVASGNYLGYNGSEWVPTAPAGGVTDHGLLTGLDDDDHSAIYYNKSTIDTTMSGISSSIYNASGILNTKIDTVSGYLDSKINIASCSDVELTSIASGQILSYNGSGWVNTDAPSSEGGGGGLALCPSIYLRNIDGFSMNTSTDTSIPFPSHYNVNEDYFTHSTSTNNGDITCISTGLYFISGNFYGGQDNYGSGDIIFSIYVNSARLDQTEQILYRAGTGQQMTKFTGSISVVVSVSSGQTLQIRVRTNDAATMWSSSVSIIKIG